MDQRDIAVLLALMRVERAGNAVGRRALSMAQFLGASVSDTIASDPRDLLSQIPANAFDTVLHAARRLDDDAIGRAVRHVDRVISHGVRCFAFTDEQYLHLLSVHLGDAAPALVWCVGNLELLRNYGIGIVGTRTPSHTGETITADCARLFARENICVVSGGADGIDTAAHRASLDAGGSTIVVLPQGIRTYTFPDWVRDAIESDRCALVSQFDPEMNWQTHAAVTRNATIAALSKLVCVIEPKRMGGSMRTAKHAHEQGKPIFYFCRPNSSAAFQTLKGYAARPILRTDSAINSSAIRSAWQTALDTGPRQSEFDTTGRATL